VNYALFRPCPPQLTVAGERSPKAFEVLHDAVEGPAEHERRQRLNARHHQLCAAAAGEGEPVTLNAAIRLQHHVGRRIVRARVHGVRAGQRL